MVLVMLVVTLPSLLATGADADSAQMIALIALVAGALTLVEYNATYPSMVEFRDAPPFNRIRFLMLFATVLFLTIIARGDHGGNPVFAAIQATGHVIGYSMDFPYSPVRLAILMGGQGMPPEMTQMLRSSAGMAYLISLVSLTFFMILLKAGKWPRQSNAFNVWVNLPTFDPTHGADVVSRLYRDARFNIGLGFLLPFLSPAVIRIGATGFDPLSLTSPQTMVWAITAWSFLPASLFMRGIAMARVADMIRETRAANRMATVDRDYAAA